MIIRSDEEKNEVKEMVGADVERIMALTLPSISRLFIVFHPSSLLSVSFIGFSAFSYTVAQDGFTHSLTHSLCPAQSTQLL